MKQEKRLSLYSWRWAVGQGAHWRFERDVSAESRDGWLAQFRKDEPSVSFTVSDARPFRAPKPSI
jgi:hypothetical protein